MPVWNFAYGSHLNQQQLCRIIGEKPERAVRAMLPDHRLTFWTLTKFPKEYAHLAAGGGPAIVYHQGFSVYGAAYLITEEQFAILDEYEQAWDYQRVPFRVKTEDGSLLRAQAHNLVQPGAFIPPSAEFLQLMVTGLQEHGYSPEVIETARRAACTPL